LSIFVIENSIKLQKMTLERKIRNTLFMKQGNLSCFVGHIEISQIMVLDAMCFWYLCKSSPWVGVHSLHSLRLFGTTMWKLLIIEIFSQWRKKKKVLEFRALLGVVGKILVTQI
jgi:hypothetical protein